MCGGARDEVEKLCRDGSSYKAPATHSMGLRSLLQADWDLEDNLMFSEFILCGIKNSRTVERKTLLLDKKLLVLETCRKDLDFFLLSRVHLVGPSIMVPDTGGVETFRNKFCATEAGKRINGGGSKP
ncbi:hypothetical protein M9H77_07865 [Catharanthus roseus]|uniref:Uncharacterized protein n=1 Tax=Catharanthus roseus TaxID=4058 RepID=A0ACC0BW70_CATRO|nr:hypothetical protein M9H77_07865 [Catharanthus roseus]